MIIYLAVDDGVVTDIGFEGRGCAISMASASMMTEMLRGKSLDEVQAMFAEFHALVASTEPACEAGFEDPRSGQADRACWRAGVPDAGSSVRLFPGTR